MESIGEKLRSEREQKSLSIEQIARDTNIAKRFLAALEAEDFSVFPGDPYLIGFLKNYAEYLGLDPDEMVALYRNFTLQSQPVPMEELLDRSRPKRARLVVFLCIVAAAIVTLGIIFFPKIFPGIARDDTPDTDVAPSSTTYRLEKQPLDRRFIVDDVVIVTSGEAEFEITIAKIANDVTLDIPGGTSVMRIGDERSFDLDGDTKMDLTVALTDVDADANPPSAVLQFTEFKTVATEILEPVTGTSVETASGAAEIGAPALESRIVESEVIARAGNAKSFRASAIFRGYCLVRYIIDGEQREERYFQKGETLELDIASELRLWISNAGSMNLKIDGVTLDLGRSGEVSTRIVAWNRAADSSEYLLSVSPMY